MFICERETSILRAFVNWKVVVNSDTNFSFDQMFTAGWITTGIYALLSLGKVPQFPCWIFLSFQKL